MNNSNELRHYGVLGMKWGVRRNPSKAYAKASKKATRLQNKADKLRRKSDKYMDKGLRRSAKYRTSIGEGKARKEMLKGSKYYRKSERYRKKANRWTKSMAKTFANTKRSEISQEHIDTGRQYVYMLMRD